MVPFPLFVFGSRFPYSNYPKKGCLLRMSLITGLPRKATPPAMLPEAKREKTRAPRSPWPVLSATRSCWPWTTSGGNSAPSWMTTSPWLRTRCRPSRTLSRRCTFGIPGMFLYFLGTLIPKKQLELYLLFRIGTATWAAARASTAWLPLGCRRSRFIDGLGAQTGPSANVHVRALAEPNRVCCII